MLENLNFIRGHLTITIDRSLGQGHVFTSICDSVQGVGGVGLCNTDPQIEDRDPDDREPHTSNGSHHSRWYILNWNAFLFC